jgi:L-alanine-DL-glutamate epimerase-like enolase superfamily enzyme
MPAQTYTLRSKDMKTDIPIEKISVTACGVPTDFPEADGTMVWDSTTLVAVQAEGGGKEGLGFTYADKATAVFIDAILSKVVTGENAMEVRGVWVDMVLAIRNQAAQGWFPWPSLR